MHDLSALLYSVFIYESLAHSAVRPHAPSAVCAVDAIAVDRHVDSERHEPSADGAPEAVVVPLALRDHQIARENRIAALLARAAHGFGPADAAHALAEEAVEVVRVELAVADAAERALVVEVVDMALVMERETVVVSHLRAVEADFVAVMDA